MSGKMDDEHPVFPRREEYIVYRRICHLGNLKKRLPSVGFLGWKTFNNMVGKQMSWIHVGLRGNG